MGQIQISTRVTCIGMYGFESFRQAVLCITGDIIGCSWEFVSFDDIVWC